MIVNTTAAALSSRRQDLIDQPIVCCFERIEKSNSRQLKAVPQVRCAATHNIASQNASRLFFTASSAAERSSSVPCTGSTARQASIVVFLPYELPRC